MLELKDLDNKVIYELYGWGVGNKVKKNGYLELIVDYKMCCDCVLSVYKVGLSSDL